MANSKNTIQNIPLAASLNMNMLKTDVKQFNGYNEKNSTVFGGTLSPLYDKKSSLFSKKDSYTVFNNNSVPFSIVKENNEIHVYKNDTIVPGLTGKYVNKTEKLTVPYDTVVAVKCPDGGVMYVNKSGKVIKDGTQVTAFGVTGIVEAQIWFIDGNTTFIGAMNESKCQLIYLPLSGTEIKSTVFTGLSVTSSDTPLITYGKKNGVHSFAFAQNSGRIGVQTSIYNFKFVNNAFSTDGVQVSLQEDLNNPGELVGWPTISSIEQNAKTWRNWEISQFAYRRVVVGETDFHFFGQTGLTEDSKEGDHYTGVSGNYVPCPLGVYSTKASIYYQTGSLISIGSYGVPIDECLNYGRNMISVWDVNNIYSITYKKNDNNWYAYTILPVSQVTSNIEDYLSRMVFDERYIFIKNDSGLTIYDTDKEEVRLEKNMDWIMSVPPYANFTYPDSLPFPNGTVTGAVYGGGVNAGYKINGSPFVGYTPNPFVVKDFPLSFTTDNSTPDPIVLPDAPETVQFYCSRGATVQSAKYIGKESQYFGTIYPIDVNGNVVLPVSINAEIIRGYSNNDMVKERGSVYPLMYYNNNMKTYTYFLLSAIENVDTVFSLQGQQYTTDDNSIYAVNFNNGVVSNVTPVCYKKNMEFKGTLPTQAIFWSKFNKTFYSFTGDRILSKMFEASDINEIYYVGQNSASLSLWFCTDNGIYIISDTDMYRLDFISHYVSFKDKTALIVTDNGKNKETHAISLYLENGEQGEMIPVKLQTAFYGLGSELKAVMDCWYIRLYDPDRTEGNLKVRVNTITDVTRHAEEKSYPISPSDYDDNNMIYIKYQPKYQECVAMQLELESNIGIYSLSLGVNTTDSVPQATKFNF